MTSLYYLAKRKILSIKERTTTDRHNERQLSYSDDVKPKENALATEKSESRSSSESDDSWTDEGDSDLDYGYEDESNEKEDPSLFFVDSGLVKIPDEVSIFSSKYHWCQRFGRKTSIENPIPR